MRRPSLEQALIVPGQELRFCVNQGISFAQPSRTGPYQAGLFFRPTGVAWVDILSEGVAGSSRQGSACLAMAPSGRPIGGRALAPGPLATCRASLANGASIRVAAAAAGISVGRAHQVAASMKPATEMLQAD